MLKISKRILQQRLDRYAKTRLPKRCEYLGNGYSRSAMFDPKENIVFKVGSERNNFTEWMYWKCLPKLHKKFFAEVYGMSRDGTILAMEYVPGHIDYNGAQKVEAFIRNIGLYGLAWDMHTENIRLNKRKQIKVIDYGELMFGNNELYSHYERYEEEIDMPSVMKRYRKYFKHPKFQSHKIRALLQKGISL